MNLILKHVLPNFILVSSMLYIWHKLQNKKINFSDKRLYITLIAVMGISIFNYMVVNKFIKICLITIIFMFFFKYLFKETIQNCIITPIFYQLIVMISETLFALFLSVVLKIDPQMFLNSYCGLIVTNLSVACISMIFSNLKFINKLYKLILNLTDKIKTMQLITLCLIIIIISNVLAMTIYYKIEFQYLLIFNVLMTLIYYFVVFYAFKTQNNYNKVSDKYNVAINSLKEYENMMTKYRIDNHENKNLLKTIRAMIISKEENIPEFIDSIVEDKYEDNEKLLFEMNVIPSGGLRATIYSEILKIKENNISYSLDIDRKLKMIDLIELDTDDVIDICKIVCVFIDNAIEGVIGTKRKHINISLYLEDDLLNIKVSNNYKGKIDVNKIFNDGYTTKGKGHGYGLCLVKKIVLQNKNLGNKTEINKAVFGQILSIKYKKHIK